MKVLRIGEKVARIPVIQGGMGVGVSRSNLAGAVAREGGIGIISTAQIGYDEEEFETDPPIVKQLKSIFLWLRKRLPGEWWESILWLHFGIMRSM